MISTQYLSDIFLFYIVVSPFRCNSANTSKIISVKRLKISISAHELIVIWNTVATKPQVTQQSLCTWAQGLTCVGNFTADRYLFIHTRVSVCLLTLSDNGTWISLLRKGTWVFMRVVVEGQEIMVVSRNVLLSYYGKHLQKNCIEYTSNNQSVVSKV